MTDRRHLSPLSYGPRRREYVYAAAAVALALFAWNGGDVPEDRVLQPLAPSEVDCQRYRSGQWLYGAIKHDGDRMHWSQCFYGHGMQRFVL